ncbi:hypothetical protein J6590_075992 [Homalodisca vitripennis]|nr:hypothetical protein J6590_075992 [Homalodisca vitripennis]
MDMGIRFLQLTRVVQNRRRCLLSSGVVVLHNSARPQVAGRTRTQLGKFCRELLDHLSQSPDLAPSDSRNFLMEPLQGG